jgi:hypothetical protein
MTDDTTNDVYELTDEVVEDTSSKGGYIYSSLSSVGGTSFNYTTGTPTVTASLSSSLNGTTGALGASPWGYNNTISATASPYLSTNGYMYPNTITSGHILHVSSDARIDGDLTVKGVNLTERLDQIEHRLGILRPNNDLEGKWEQLKALGDQYRQLEKEILEKESMWDILKK